MGIEEKLPAGILLTTVEQVAGFMRKSSVWPATFGLACCAIEMMAVGTPDYDIARFGMERFSATPRQAIVQGVDHILPVDVYLPGCPPRPEMLLNAILTLHDQIQNTKMGVNRVAAARAAERAALAAVPTHLMAPTHDHGALAGKSLLA